MARYRNIAFLVAIIAVALSAWSCSDDDDNPGPVNAAPEMELLAPSGGQTVPPGTSMDITWSGSDDVEILRVTLSYTDDSQSGAYTEIVTDQPASGTYAWTTPNQTLFGVRVKAVAVDQGDLTGEDTSDLFAVVNASARGYVTSSICQSCHPSQYDAFRMSGHPYKINKVDGGPPTYPFTSVPNPPTGFTWDDITYVIGGYAWKARFMGDDGFILVTGVTGGNTQYNLVQTDVSLDEVSWSDYHAGDLVPKPFTCGTCHTTGWQDLTENGGVNQDGLPGIYGTWEEPGIQCEACHGSGGAHVATKQGSEITRDTSSELCGSCHFRDTNHGILASGGFIRHHEQYDEMISAGHAFQKCTTCHDPHVGVKHGNREMGGIKVECTSSGCHAGTVVNHGGSDDCESCHMPHFSKSSRASNYYTGDVQTHIFKIDSSVTDKNDMFYEEDGQTFAHGFLSLDVACYQCHTDDDGVGGAAGFGSPKTIAELEAKAGNIHP